MPKGVYIRTKKHRKALRESKKGKHYSLATEFQRGNVPWNKGLKGWAKKYKNVGFQKGHGYLGGGGKKGVRNSPKTEFKKGFIPWNKGQHGLQKAWNKGLGNGNRTARLKEMGTWQYAQWRTSVFVRDNYTCQQCGERGGRLQADHIKMWILYPKLRYDVNNGQTLCRECSIEKTRKELKLYWKNQYAISGLYSGVRSAVQPKKVVVPKPNQ